MSEPEAACDPAAEHDGGREKDCDRDYTEFVQANWHKLLRLARLLTGDEHRGEELLQDSLVKLYVRWRKIGAAGDPLAYLRVMLVNGRVSWWRRMRREYLFDAIPVEHADRSIELAQAGGGAGARFLDEDLRQALRALPTGQRAVVVLRHCEDLTERETAAVLGCSIGTVKSQNARAMAALRARLIRDRSEERSST
jgi:RNA polymerase sigma-70 factor (sigma-E family)